MGKKQTFKNYGLLNISCEAEIHTNRAIQSQIHSAIINQDEITDQDEINKQIFSFYQSLFSRQVQVQIDGYLDNIPLPKLTNEQTLSLKVLYLKMRCLKVLNLLIIINHL